LQYRGQYNDLGEYDSALHYVKKALDIVTARKDTLGLSECYSRLGNVYKKMGNKIEALYYFQTAFNINESNPSENLLRDYTDVLMNKGKYKEAESILSNIMLHGGGPQAKLNAITAMIVLKKKQHKYKEALDLTAEYIEQDNDLLNIEKIKQIAELQTQYDVANKENQIDLLQERNEHQAKTLKQNKIIVFASFGLLLMILVAVFLLYRNRAVRLQAEKILLEQQLLRSQMNPHFIFNCLSNIQSTVLQQEYLKAAGYIATFSKLVRNILQNSTESKVTFAAELTALQDYLSLQKIRFQNRLEYHIDIDPEIEEDMIYIPPMLFQPLVENALEHGIINVPEGFISIAFRQHKKFIRCVVTDNGSGYGNADENGRKNKDKQSLSTTIIKKRLAIFSKHVRYALQYHIQALRSDEGTITGTKVEIDIPILYK
jgi:tetratricopeptide (TPR) repeat protein